MEKQENEIIRLMRPMRLTETADGIEADLILGVLAEQEIAAYKRPLESGGVMNTYMGFSIFGAEILVDEEDYEAAKALLDEIQIIEDEMADGWEEEDDDDEPESEYDINPDAAEGINPTGKWLFRIIVYMIIAGILLWAVSVIISLVYVLIFIKTG